ncbi:MAG: Hsp20/alpha crystallin family protein [Nitrospirota bacterium]
MAVKRVGFPASVMGEEFKNLLRLIEEDEKSSGLGETSGPLLDLYETKESVVVEADLPGIDPSEIGLCIFHGFLTIEGNKSERLGESEKVNYLCMERSFEPFRRIIRITVPINPKEGRAVYARGVLTVTFPKIKEKRGEPIKIKIERAQ